MVELVPGIFRPRRRDGDEDAAPRRAAPRRTTPVAYVNLYGERIHSSTTIEKSPACNMRLIDHLGDI